VKHDPAGTGLAIRELYPDFSDEQLREAEETLHTYAAIVWRICERLDRERDADFDGRQPIT
jgi:hypothetical protein